MNKDIIGQNIQYYRKKLNLTQNELAEKVGVTWEMISRYERGRSSSLQRLDELSEALNVDYSQILEDRDNPSPVKLQTGLPFFVKLPKNLSFTAKNTDVYYSAPQWISHKYKHSFAIRSDIINVKTIRIEKASVLYVTPNLTPHNGDVVLVSVGNNVDAITYDSRKKPSVLIGIIISQEIRFI